MDNGRYTLIAYSPSYSERNCSKGCCGSTYHDSRHSFSAGLSLEDLKKELSLLFERSGCFPESIVILTKDSVVYTEGSEIYADIDGSSLFYFENQEYLDYQALMIDELVLEIKDKVRSAKLEAENKEKQKQIQLAREQEEKAKKLKEEADRKLFEQLKAKFGA